MSVKYFVNRIAADHKKRVEGATETLKAYLEFRGTAVPSIHHALARDNLYAKSLLPEYMAAVIGGELEPYT